jgi:S1-C subfamily serine protease
MGAYMPGVRRFSAYLSTIRFYPTDVRVPMNDRLPTRPRLLGMVAATLLAATAITTAVTVLPATQVRAEAVQAIDPTRGFADLVDRVMPAVVSVQVKYANVASADNGDGSGDDGQQAMPDLPQGTPFDDFFRQFRQGRPTLPQRQPSMAQGSGFIISADGYAVTNNHVVKDASRSDRHHDATARNIPADGDRHGSEDRSGADQDQVG